MSALLLTIVHTNNVYAQSYTADDTYIIGSNIHDFFKYYFGEDASYQYFSYKCNSGNYERNCYYGIDSSNNYVKIEYQDNGSYSYNQKITTGVDENFSVTGTSVFKKGFTQTKFTNMIIIFALSLFVLLILMRCL